MVHKLIDDDVRNSFNVPGTMGASLTFDVFEQVFDKLEGDVFLAEQRHLSLGAFLIIGGANLVQILVQCGIIHEIRHLVVWKGWKDAK